MTGRGGSTGGGGGPRRVAGPAPFARLRPDSHRHSGFTLVELLVTLLILGVLAGVAAPAFRTAGTPTELDDAAGRVEALFRLARDSAIASGARVTVTVDSASGRVWIDALPSAATPEPLDSTMLAAGALGSGPPRSRAPGRTLGQPEAAPAPESLDLPASVRLEVSSARAHFTFSPRGGAAGDTIRLSDGSGAIRLLALDPWTGHVVSN